MLEKKIKKNKITVSARLTQRKNTHTHTLPKHTKLRKKYKIK